MMERRRGMKIRAALEIAGALSGITLAVIAYTQYKHSLDVEGLASQHSVITEAVRVESDARYAADFQLEKEIQGLEKSTQNLVDLNQKEISSLSRLTSEMKIALNKIGLDGE